jgi:hypothetical protein
MEYSAGHCLTAKFRMKVVPKIGEKEESRELGVRRRKTAESEAGSAKFFFRLLAFFFITPTR